MLRIDILTLFPNMFDGFLTESILSRAIAQGKIAVNIIDFRKYSKDPHGKVDDTPYGGGRGMVLTPQPIFDAVEELRGESTKVILLTPDGQTYTQPTAYQLSQEEHLILICGHYEGFDERIRTLADMEISIGDYVLTGGEIPSMIITDSVMRLLEGVIEKESHMKDSFQDLLLDYPTYTKPREFRDMKVPEVLLSGDHKKIAQYRYMEQLERTKKRRPDLIERRNQRQWENKNDS